MDRTRYFIEINGYRIDIPDHVVRAGLIRAQAPGTDADPPTAGAGIAGELREIADELDSGSHTTEPPDHLHWSERIRVIAAHLDQARPAETEGGEPT